MQVDDIKILRKSSLESFYMRTIVESDLELLRTNKNKNKNFFFIKEEITPEQQKNWFNKIKNEKENLMFVCLESEKIFGCIGYRNLGEVVDVYNVMRFEKSETSMIDCIHLLIEEINKNYKNFPIQVIVLKNNPAIQWYEKVGFKKIMEMEDSVKMYFKND